MKILRALILFGLLLSFFGGGVSAVNAQQPPVLPASFYGEIHFMPDDGVPSVGDYLEAFVPGNSSYVVRTQIVSYDSKLVYAIRIPGDDLATTAVKEGGVEGDQVTFKIGTRVVALATWHSGTNVSFNIHPPKANAGGPYVAVVNETFSLTGSATDWLTGETYTYAWDLDNDGAYDDSTSRTPSYLFTTSGTKTVGLQVTDSQGGKGYAQTQVVVISISGLTGQIYDGTPKSITVSGVTSPYTFTVTYNGSGTPPTNAGDYTVVISIWNGTTLVGTIDETLSIALRPASVTPANNSKVYGATDPTLTGTLTGFIAGDGITATYTRTSGENVGSYVISATLAPAAKLVNYSITYNTGTFTITPRPITVTADNKSKVYGTSDPVLTYTITAGSLVPGDNFTGALTRDSGEDIGTYTIRQGNLALNANYNLTFVNGTFTITALAHNIDLIAGWNLVSFNLHPVNTSIATVLNSISGYYDIVYAWDATGAHSAEGHWMVYDPDAVTGNTLSTLDETQGFWIYMDEARTLSVSGTPPTTTSIVLQTGAGGWNLVGYPSNSNLAPSTAFADLTPNLTLAYGFDGSDTADPWELFDPSAPPYANDMELLVSGHGYWIYVTAEDTWDVEY